MAANDNGQLSPNLELKDPNIRSQLLNLGILIEPL